MYLFTRVLVLMGVLSICHSTASSQNITILNSQSVHHSQTMDQRWYDGFQSFGYNANIQDYDFLDNDCLIDETDVLIVSTAVKNISTAHRSKIKSFVDSGGMLYLQGEFETHYPGNEFFYELANAYGDNFTWGNSFLGDIGPVNILTPLNNNHNNTNQLNYFWYGLDATFSGPFTPIVNKGGNDLGFIFKPQVANAGVIITMTDQDWIRLGHGNAFLQNIIQYLAHSANNLTQVYPGVEIATNDQNFCQGEDAFFTSEIITPNNGQLYPSVTGYQWLLNGQPILGENGPTLTINTLQDGDVIECQIEVEHGCKSFNDISNPILMAPIFPINTASISISINQLTTCENATNEFELDIINPDGITISQFQWGLNNIQLTNTNTDNLTFNDLMNGDQISIRYAVDDPCYGEIWVDGMTLDVIIYASVQPTVLLNNPILEFCEGAPESYSITGEYWGTDPVIEWLVNGIVTETGSANFTPNNLNPGNHTITANVWSSEPCVAESMVQSTPMIVTVNAAGVLVGNLVAATTELCQGVPAEFTIEQADLGTAGIVNWYVDGNLMPQSGLTFQLSNPQNNQEVHAVLSTSADCYAVNTLNLDPIVLSISENQTPYISIDADALKVCHGQSVTLEANGNFWGDNPVIDWIVNGVSQNVATTTALELAVYDENTIVQANLISDFECVTTNEVISENLVLATAPISIEALSITPEHCAQKDGGISIAVDGGFGTMVATWDDGNRNLERTELSAGIFNITIIDSLGCEVAESFEVPEEIGPQIQQLDIVQPDCEVQSFGQTRITLDVPETEVSIYWMDEFQNEIADGNAALELTPGNYMVEIVDDFGCVTNESFEIEEIHPIFVAAETAFEMQLGETMELDPGVISGDENISYSWSSNIEALECTDCETITIAPTESSRYELILTNSSGCTEVVAFEVRVRKNYEVYLPNVFSPNGDGSNDFWNISVGDQVASVEKISVFNRWGAPVYQNSQPTPNNSSEGWDGTYKGKSVQPGVYIATVEVIFKDGEKQVFSGDISILR